MSQLDCVDKTRYNNAIDNNYFRVDECMSYGNDNCFNLNSQTGINHDECYISNEEKNNMKINVYNLNNFKDCKCDPETTMKLSNDNLTTNISNGYGWSACNIEVDSKLRTDNLTNLNCNQDLRHRPYPTVPYMGRGMGDTDVESVLRPGENTIQDKSCNNLAGISIDNYYTPMIQCLKDNIQNPVHIIPEMSDETWKRGGQDTRQIVRNSNYLKQCGYNYNGKYWSN